MLNTVRLIGAIALLVASVSGCMGNRGLGGGGG